MSAIISAFVALVLSAALVFGAENGQTEAKANIEGNIKNTLEADSHLDDKESEPQPTPTPKPLLSVTPGPQKPLLEAVAPPVKIIIGEEVSAEAKSDSEAEVNETDKDNAGETHGQAVSEEAKTEVSENISVEIPEIVSVKLGF